jgi:hypothetical protein
VQPAEVDEEEPKLKSRLVHVDDQDWREFQRKHGKGRVSARIRELVREDIERG